MEPWRRAKVDRGQINDCPCVLLQKWMLDKEFGLDKMAHKRFDLLTTPGTTAGRSGPSRVSLVVPEHRRTSTWLQAVSG